MGLVQGIPNSEMHGVDASAGLLKYAFVESNARGHDVHCHQENLEKMKCFEDESVGLIVSHIIFHEASREAIANILAGCRRILRRGGVMVHVDVCNKDWYWTERRDRFFKHWQTHFNVCNFIIFSYYGFLFSVQINKIILGETL